MRELGRGGPKIAPLVLGGNVFGWTADKPTSFAVLDAFVGAGFNAVDTADVYSRWVPGHSGGESETVLGDWMADRAARDRIVLITKVGTDMGGDRKGLRAAYIVDACEASLRRLKTDRIDLYLAHFPDPATPIAETLEAFERLVSAGKVKAVGGSNYTADGLAEALNAAGQGRARYSVLQPHFNLLTRDQYEGPLEDLCAAQGLGVIPYYGLASGFLTGKYRSEADLGKSPRGGRMKAYLDARGLAVLAALDAMASRHNATPAQVALAWLIARPSITAPIASATSVAQLLDIARSVEIQLSRDDLTTLNV